ncbi:hypothetical protein BDA99DRAFT_610054 [Phascolomyces articulosus]|uniref:Uncharacterized protein n=1 Tax=Phascolomyces articulosus TaxID=60185 RepID=A0AAD5P7A7_9FUNG|nr:hypothetical protein BDA99DRAFT_610054 [Phascolomyces articulosus]
MLYFSFTMKKNNNSNGNKKQSSTNTEQNPSKDYDQLAKKLKARLQYARFKVQNGMTDQSLEQMENKVERQLSHLELLSSINNDFFVNKRGHKSMTITNDGFPPTPPQTQRRGRRSRKSEREEEERAARNLMMISSSPGGNPPKNLKRPHHQHAPPPTASPSSNPSTTTTIGYTNMNSPTLPSFQDVVSRVPDYDRKSRQFAESFQQTPPVGALPIDPGSISTRFPYFPPVNWTGALPPVDNPYSTSDTRTPPSPGYRYTMNRLH